MPKPLILTTELREVPPNRAVHLANIICPYCGASLDDTNSTEDHVVGRRFVPKGTLNGHWNLIFNACQRCNCHKSDLEDDISAVSMQPDIGGTHLSAHPQLADDASRKARGSVSRRTGKLVSDSQETINIHGQFFPGLTAKLGLVSPPQVDEWRAFQLARYHFQAFFYMITYDHLKNRGWWWKGEFVPIMLVARRDWGNDVCRDFMKKVFEWDPRVIANTAEGHFKLSIRRNIPHELWSMAVEWNENYRVLAMCGESAAIRRFIADLPKLPVETLYESGDRAVRFRFEKPLSNDDDLLFATAEKTDVQ